MRTAKEKFYKKFPMVASEIWPWIEENVICDYVMKVKARKKTGYYIRIFQYEKCEYALVIVPPNGKALLVFPTMIDSYVSRVDSYGCKVYERKIDAVRMAKKLSLVTGLEFRGGK